MKQESSGTLKKFALYPSLKDVQDNGGTLFIDELNARLHPLLVRNIILTFLSPEINTQNAQLIFTPHDIWQFSNELLHRDGAIPALKPMKMLTGRAADGE